MTVGLVAAMPAEVSCLNGRNYELNRPFRIGQHLLAIISGMGANHARRAAELLQFHHVSAVISWGTAAGLSQTAPGDLLLPVTVIGANGKKFDTDSAWCRQLARKMRNLPVRIHTDPLAETRILLESVPQKMSLHEETGAIAADMESATLARVARDNHLPFIVVRAVADNHDQVLPYAVTRHIDVFGKPDINGIIFEILKNPRLVPQLLQLAQAMRKAMATLRTTARQGHEILGSFY